jgi:hypothetical protein
VTGYGCAPRWQPQKERALGHYFSFCLGTISHSAWTLFLILIVHLFQYFLHSNGYRYAELAAMIPGEFRILSTLESKGKFHDQACIRCCYSPDSHGFGLFLHGRNHQFFWRFDELVAQ